MVFKKLRDRLAGDDQRTKESHAPVEISLPRPGERVAIVTGGGSGIGKACVLRLAKEGYRLLVCGRDQKKCDDVCAAIRDGGGKAVAVTGNVARKADCHNLAVVATERWGRIDVLIANAGARIHGSIQDAEEADWAEIIGVNLRGVADPCAAVIPTMKSQGVGSIVVVSSVHALAGRAEIPLYDASKAGALGLVRSLAAAHGRDGIRLNAVCPGFTTTECHEENARRNGISPEKLRENARGYGLLGRPAEPDEIAAAVCFLAGGDASNITGQSLMVDGGISVSTTF